MDVLILNEGPRECGYRKPSKDGVGIYLRGMPFNERCERLPWPLDTCPCCGAGFKYTRGFSWIDPGVLFDPYKEPCCTVLAEPDPNPKHAHEYCYMCNPELLGGRAGLIWIGEKFYKTPSSFMREAETMGISRKIAAVPNNFTVGEDAIFLAHRLCIRSKTDAGEFVAGVFAAFKPTHIDLVIADETRVPDKAIEIAKRLGPDKCRIVKVIHDKPEETDDVWAEWDDA